MLYMRDNNGTHRQILHFRCSFFTPFRPVALIRAPKNWSMSSLPAFNELVLSIGWTSMSASIPFASRASGSFDAVDVRVFLANSRHVGSTAINLILNKHTCWVRISACIFACGIHNFIVIVIVAILNVHSLFARTAGSGWCGSIRTDRRCSS
jgi:hypothetical protein